MDYMDDQLLSQ